MAERSNFDSVSTASKLCDQACVIKPRKQCEPLFLDLYIWDIEKKTHCKISVRLFSTTASLHLSPPFTPAGRGVSWWCQPNFQQASPEPLLALNWDRHVSLVFNFLLACPKMLAHNVDDILNSWVGQDNLSVLLHSSICLSALCMRNISLVQTGNFKKGGLLAF